MLEVLSLEMCLACQTLGNLLVPAGQSRTRMDASVTVRFSGLRVSTEQGSRSHVPVSRSSDPTDEVLLEQLYSGNREALSLLFRRHARTLRAVALRVLRDVSEADDLVQDVFVLIHRFSGTFDSSKGSAQFWMMQLTYRRAISRRRYLSSRHFYTRLDLADELLERSQSLAEQSHDLLNRVPVEIDLQKMLGTLSEDQQKTLRLHFIEGYTLDETAKILGQSKGNVRHHSFRGLERLRKLIFAGKLLDGRAV